MGAVIVDDQMQGQPRRSLAIKLAQKFQIFLMAMARHTLTDDRAVQNIERGKQRRRTVPFIVMSHGTATAFLKRQARLRSLQGLNLALFINAQYQGFNGRIQVQAYDIVEFFDEPFIFGKFEGTRAVWLQAIGIPDPLHRRRLTTCNWAIVRTLQ